MIKKIRSYHDTYFQAMMEKLEVARSFFQAHVMQGLIESINWDTLAIADAVRRSSHKKPTYTDITYRASIKNSEDSIFLHVEQERGIDKRMLERIWQYNLGLVAKYRNQGYNKLPLIINFVVCASTITHILLVVERTTKEVLPGTLYTRALERSW